uniref:Solute carrier family 35 member F1 n=1 Tax=Hucho hucho TaxID=62062 RepID=A0A4W5PPT8_9TELE
MYTLYTCMPLVVKKTSATAVNLSLLTADLLSLFCGLFLFQYTFSGLYIVSLVIILVGFVSFNTVATTPNPADPIPPPEVVVAVLEEKEEQEEEEGQCPGVSWNQRTQNEEVPAGGRSTKM